MVRIKSFVLYILNINVQETHPNEDVESLSGSISLKFRREILKAIKLARE